MLAEKKVNLPLAIGSLLENIWRSAVYTSILECPVEVQVDSCAAEVTLNIFLPQCSVLMPI